MSYLKLAYKTIEAGPLTPQKVFEKVPQQYSCLLESGKYGRYSYVAYDPFAVLAFDGQTIHLTKRRDFCSYKRSPSGQIMDHESEWAVTDVLSEFVYKGKAPVPFCGGAAGFMTYDYGCRFVGVKQKVFDDMGIPEYVFGFYDKVIAFDHEKNLVYLLASDETDSAAERKVDSIVLDLERPARFLRKGDIGEVKSNVSLETYKKKVGAVKEYLKSGDTYQVNFSQRFMADCTLDPWKIYQSLARANPSPFACYFDYPDFQVVSCSPELLLRKRAKRLETWPIKGTVPRGRNQREDEKNAGELLASEKDNAELTMIVDLARNDLGKVCDIGSVALDSHRDIEQYSHVIHTVSRISGKLAPNRSVFDAVRSLFPGGSITGCPKKRTMEIIDELEDFKRGIYTGSAGYISFNGEADFNILIRSMLMKDQKVYYSAGGGIVVDSDPQKEYEESVQKALALKEALAAQDPRDKSAV